MREDWSKEPGSVGAEAPEQLSGVQMKLVGAELWRKFHAVNTEMIITKLGRNMFPVLTAEVSGLEPEARYFVIMEICLSSDRRYKFVGRHWKATGTADLQLPRNARVFIHQDSPATGAHWMREPIKMKSAKLTNNSMNRSGHVVLTSMHKYIPRIHVVKTSDIMALSWSPTATFMFPETEFIAVTAYQNERVTMLKIDNNPFAKGFRENGLSYVKRKETATASHRKRHCPERSSLSSVDSSQSASPPVAEECNSNDENTEHILHSQNESSSPPSFDSPREDISTALTNISINTNSLHYPYAGIYSPYYQYQDESIWRYHCLLPPPPPLLPSPPHLLPPILLPFPYPISPYLSHPLHHLTQSCIAELNPQPYDYSMRERSN